MSILGNIMSSILGSRGQPAPRPSAGLPTAEPAPASRQPLAPSRPAPSPAPPATPTPPSVGQRATAEPQGHAEPARAEAPRSPATTAQVDVAAVLDQRAENAAEELDWRVSIVDLMKLLQLD